MRIAVFTALGLLIGILLFLWLMTRIRYRIGSKHVKVLLFGLCVRRLAYTKIESVSKRKRDGWSEHWWSTTRPKHRMLVIRRKRGLIRNFVVTPKNRYVFKTELERCLRRIGNPPPPEQNGIEPDPPDGEADGATPRADLSSKVTEPEA